MFFVKFNELKIIYCNIKSEYLRNIHTYKQILKKKHSALK